MEGSITVNPIKDTGFILGGFFEPRDIGKMNLYHNPFPESPF